MNASSIEGFHAVRPSDFADIVKATEQFVIQFVLKAALKLKLLEKVGNFPVANFPVPKYFRREATFQKTGWEIVDGETLRVRYVPELNKEEKKLSPPEFWNDTLLRERLEAGWRLEDWS